MVWRIIGVMTGNSMDAIDVVLTEFNGNNIKDVCSYSQAFSKEIQQDMEYLRKLVSGKEKKEILSLPCFKQIHDTYIEQIAQCIFNMCQKYGLDKNTIDAIGFSGKTLDHCPPSCAKITAEIPYTLEIGSGKMLADLTGIKVIYDFRSPYLMQGFEGAPLIPIHNAHIAFIEGDGWYYNGGNTSNFALIDKKIVKIASDSGPFNEYIDNFIRQNTLDAFDKDGKYGKQGRVNVQMLQECFNICREFYECPLPKSGDPQYYHKEQIFEYINSHHVSFVDVVRTLEYFASYIAVYTLTLIEGNFELPQKFLLFGGGWKNPVVLESFKQLLYGKGIVLPEHKQQFYDFLKRFRLPPVVQYSNFGTMMEARLFADLARYRLENRAWEVQECFEKGVEIISGIIALPEKERKFYDDMLNVGAKGWEKH